MFERLRLTVGEGVEDDPAAGGGGGGSNGAAWYAPAETLKQSDPEVWQSFEKGVQSGNHKDLPTLIKHTVGLEKRLGTAFNLPDKNKPEEVAAFKSKLYQAGVLTPPPESPDKYELNLDAIPEGMRSEEFVKDIRAWAHKHGLSNGALAELAEMEGKRYQNTVEPAIKAGMEQSMKDFGEWATSLGKSTTEMEAYGGAYIAKNFTPEQVAALEAVKIPGPNGTMLNLASHPVLMKLIAKAGMDTGEDISTVGEGEGERSPDALAAEQEANDIIRNKENPKYKLFWQGDKATQDHVQSLMRKAHPEVAAT